MAVIVASLLTTNSQGAAAPPTAVTRVGKSSATALPGVLAGPLDGLPTVRGVALRRPMAVMIDNTVPDAQPHPGLKKASVVFESVVEGGLTRLMAIYLEHGAASIGPVRSSRPYFVAWAAGYKALFVHAGGSPAAQRLLLSTPQLANVEATLPAGHFSRLGQHVPPHDLFGSTNGVRSLARQKRWDVRVDFPWVPHRKPASVGLRGGQQTIAIDFSTQAAASPSAYSVTYTYDPQRNTYLRSMGGNPDVDSETGNQIEATNVVVLFASIRPIPRDTQGRVDVRAVGTGESTYFRDGEAVHGHWSKASVVAPLRLLDDRGRPVSFNPGSIWVEVVPPGAVRTGG